jgi:hypothetical protein
MMFGSGALGSQPIQFVEVVTNLWYSHTYSFVMMSDSSGMEPVWYRYFASGVVVMSMSEC